MRKRLLVIGDVMVDRWVEGPMTRISPEAASPIVLEQTVTHQPGGAANVAANIAALGNPVLLCGVVGSDWEGNWLGEHLANDYGIVVNLVQHPQAPTICKARITCSGQQVMRVDREKPRDVYEQCEEKVRDAIRAAMYESNALNLGAVVVADYKKGALSQGIIATVLMAAGAAGIPVLVDTKPDNLCWYRGASLLKPNFAEAKQMCLSLVHPGMIMGDDVDMAMIMSRYLRQQWDLGAVVITRGGGGATAYDGQRHYNQETESQEVYDVTGAGDTFMAMLADSVVHGRSLPESLRLSTMAATLAVRHHRTFVVTRAALDDEVLRQNGKVMPVVDAIRYVERRREAGQTIVLTNGKFRFLHHGHVETFRWAKRQGDFLIVAVNSDKSLAALRAPGAAPPNAMPEAYRAELIAQQDCVDMVVLFDDASAERVVRELKPDVLVKGAEYQSQIIPGADFVARQGGEVRFSPMIEGVSATKLADSTDERG